MPGSIPLKAARPICYEPGMRSSPGRIGPAVDRPTSWWLATLQRRAERMYDEKLEWGAADFASDEERRACINFFNAAYRAEESGLKQAHELAGEVRAFDP